MARRRRRSCARVHLHLVQQQHDRRTGLHQIERRLHLLALGVLGLDDKYYLPDQRRQCTWVAAGEAGRRVEDHDAIGVAPAEATDDARHLARGEQLGALLQRPSDREHAELGEGGRDHQLRHVEARVGDQVEQPGGARKPELLAEAVGLAVGVDQQHLAVLLAGDTAAHIERGKALALTRARAGDHHQIKRRLPAVGGGEGRAQQLALQQADLLRDARAGAAPGHHTRALMKRRLDYRPRRPWLGPGCIGLKG